MLSLGYMDRWWGPGWDGSLILGTNHRPVPAIAIERQESTPMDVAVLRWLGPWRFVTFMGQLEGDRDYDNALLFGMRIELRPLPSLQIAASRTAQWCGDGRPCDLGHVLGPAHRQRQRPGARRAAGQPARRLRRALDLAGRRACRSRSTRQAIGEDEAGFLPSKYLGLFGAETWGEVVDGTLARARRVRRHGL